MNFRLWRITEGIVACVLCLLCMIEVCLPLSMTAGYKIDGTDIVSIVHSHLLDSLRSHQLQSHRTSSDKMLQWYHS